MPAMDMPDWVSALESDPTLHRLPKPPNQHQNWVHASASGRRLSIEYFVDMAGQRMIGVATFGADAEGHAGHAHGGAIASLIDDAMGTTAWTAGHRVFTLSMTVNFRSFVPLATPVRIETSVASVDGRKVNVTCRVLTPPDNVHAEATGLFLQPR
jgi:acyl-coenzyme A thioesterase PaaI-like protein